MNNKNAPSSAMPKSGRTSGNTSMGERKYTKHNHAQKRVPQGIFQRPRKMAHTIGKKLPKSFTISIGLNFTGTLL